MKTKLVNLVTAIALLSFFIAMPIQPLAAKTSTQESVETSVEVNVTGVSEDEIESDDVEEVVTAVNGKDVTEFLNDVVSDMQERTKFLAQAIKIAIKSARTTSSVSASAAKKEEKVMYMKIGDVKVNVDEIMNIYKSFDGYKEGKLFADKENFIATSVDFWVTQMGVDKGIAAGIIGNNLREGYFGEQQHTGSQAANLDQYCEWLDRKDGRGYGIVQWTTQSRQDRLKKQLKATVEYFNTKYNLDRKELTDGKYWPMVVIMSEFKVAYDEIIDYHVFTSYETKYGVVDATGRLAVIYEGYNGASYEFKKNNGEYYLNKKSNCSGAERVECAWAAWEYMKELKVK